MKANELRIGNLVSINKRTTTMDVKTFHAVIHGFSGYDAEPIVLTEEWLLKFGFDKSNFYNNTYSKSTNTLNGSHDIFIDVSANVVLLDTIEVGNFKYVHQLQNLYFALTGEELV